MTNRYDMSLIPAPAYFGIRRYVEETKIREESIPEDDPENLDLIPGTYMTDQVHSI